MSQKILCGNCKYAQGNRPKITWNGPIPNVKWRKFVHCHCPHGSDVVQKFSFATEGCPNWFSDIQRDKKCKTAQIVSLKEIDK